MCHLWHVDVVGQSVVQTFLCLFLPIYVGLSQWNLAAWLSNTFFSISINVFLSYNQALLNAPYIRWKWAQQRPEIADQEINKRDRSVMFFLLNQNYVMFSLLKQNHRHLIKWDSCKDTLTTSLHLGTSHLHLFNFIYRSYIVDIFLGNNYNYWSHVDLLHFSTPLSPQMGREARGQKIQRTSWWKERRQTIGLTALMFLRAECRPCKQCWWTLIVSKYLLFYSGKAPGWTAVPLRLFELHSSFLELWALLQFGKCWSLWMTRKML